MIVAAKALSYEGITSLLRSREDLLQQNCFISILPEQLRKQAADLVWPANSERWYSTFFEDIRPEYLNLIEMLEERLDREIEVFDEAEADRIIDFLEKSHKRPAPETLYANCVAGVSRSGAVVSFACEAFELDRRKFLESNPQIMPNNLVLYMLRERWQLRHRESIR
ncbi:MAG: hypothetical protein K2X27_09000 [Candidatus Obscuribacterales bacterium]|nr:hypothetical protein [Candidatus Obscuribacterales bacterium]